MSDIFDSDALMANLDGDLEFLAETVEIYDEDAPELLGQVRDAIAAGDAEALAMSAHTFKGMVGNFCAQASFQAALKLEMMGKEGDLADAGGAADSLQEEADRLRAALGGLLEGGPA